MKKTIANALHSGSFSVQAGNGRSAMTQIPLSPKERGVIHLPEVDGKLITQANHESLKAHEYGHIALVERNILPLSFMDEMLPLGASDYLIQSCMDAAVNSFIGRRSQNLPFEHDLMSKKKFLEKFSEMEVDAKVSYLLQVQGVYYGGKYNDDLFSKDKDVRAEAKKLNRLREDLEKILLEEPMGRVLVKDIKHMAQYCADTLGKTSAYFNKQSFTDYAIRLITDISSNCKAKQAQDEMEETLKEYDFPIVEGCVWGRMDFKEMPLENSMMRNWKQIYKPKYMGSLRYMHRAITDMKVWGLKDRSIPPMAVLIDCSGSMNLRQEEIVAILEKQPASVIAGYSGSNEEGSLYILGQNGKYASAEEIERMRDNVGYGNIVDGPALVWLSQQKGRKIWVSDGNVTGFEETQSSGLFEFVDELLKRTGIEMYRSLYNLENGIPTTFWKRKFQY